MLSPSFVVHRVEYAGKSYVIKIYKPKLCKRRAMNEIRLFSAPKIEFYQSSTVLPGKYSLRTICALKPGFSRYGCKTQCELTFHTTSPISSCCLVVARHVVARKPSSKTQAALMLTPGTTSSHLQAVKSSPETRKGVCSKLRDRSPKK